MLLTNDIGILFSTMQAAYGHQWAHKSDAIPIWREKLKHFTPDQVMKAASEVIDHHPDFPPSIGQFIAVINKHRPQATTYLPAPEHPIHDKANADKAWDAMEKLVGHSLRDDRV